MIKQILQKKKRYDLPIVEQTPFVWDGKLMFVETWCSQWESEPWNTSNRGKSKYVRIREEGTNKIISEFAHGYGFSSAYAGDGEIYVFMGKMLNPRGVGNVVCMTKSSDLIHWTDPVVAVSEPEPERIFNQSVCYDGNRYVMVYETDEEVKFTLKFAVSDNLVNWRKLESTVFGKDRYVACPAIRFSEGYYYMFYSAWDLKKWWFETFIVRSKDLVNWEVSPYNPIIVPDNEQPVHPSCPPHDEIHGKNCAGRERNNSDADLVEWQGKTRVYFTGGCQHYGGCFQYAEYDGPMAEFFRACFE